MWSSPTRYFPKKFGAHIQKRLIYMCMQKIFYSFNALELMLHFLVEEGFLNMHSDFLLNLSPGVWTVQNIELFSLQNAFNDIIRSELNFNLLPFCNICYDTFRGQGAFFCVSIDNFKHVLYAVLLLPSPNRQDKCTWLGTFE